MQGIIGRRVQERLLERGKNPHWLHGKLQADEYKGLGSRSYGAISKYVRGQGSPPQDWTVAVASELGVRVAWLYGHGPKFEQDYPVATTYLFDIGRRAEETMDYAVAFWRIVNDKKKGFPQYSRLTPAIRTLFHNAFGRRVLVGKDIGRLLPWKERAKHAVEIGRALLDDWKLCGRPIDEPQSTVEDPLHSRLFTDYAVARLHAMMLAMPERPSR
jgi:hypothetical protein